MDRERLHQRIEEIDEEMGQVARAETRAATILSNFANFWRALRGERGDIEQEIVLEKNVQRDHLGAGNITATLKPKEFSVAEGDCVEYEGFYIRFEFVQNNGKRREIGEEKVGVGHLPPEAEQLTELERTYQWMLQAANKPRLNPQEVVSRAQSYRDKLLATA